MSDVLENYRSGTSECVRNRQLTTIVVQYPGRLEVPARLRWRTTLPTGAVFLPYTQGPPLLRLHAREGHGSSYSLSGVSITPYYSLSGVSITPYLGWLETFYHVWGRGGSSDK